VCTQFTPTRNERWVHEHLGVHLPAEPYPPETFPGYAAPIALLNDQQRVSCALARFGLIPHWAKDAKDAWRIRRADGEPMGLASLWDQWTDPGTGEVVTSFTMLTVNADGHPVMGRFHRPGDEKRSVVVLEPAQFDAWLGASVQAVEAVKKPADGLLTTGCAAFDTRGLQAGLF
jgi:putative SOS response-associated peptidase YedK